MRGGNRDMAMSGEGEVTGMHYHQPTLDGEEEE